jgi:hypothetical protein
MSATTSPTVDSNESAHLTISYTENEDGWITAQVVEIPEAISQGPSRHEAWVNVLAALHDLTHKPTLPETIAFAVQARIIEPLGELRLRFDRLGDRLRHVV